jgi:uncharacterized protein YndB with AHSA1/START domain
MSVVDLGPVVKTLDVRRAAADAFHLFTDEIGAWWPKAATRAKDAAGEKTVQIALEPRVGGRLYETLNTGEERDWGEVLVYEPGKRVVFSFQMGRLKDKSGEVEVRFDPLGDKACRVTLTHAHWERLGDEAEEMRGRYAGGWEFVFVDAFGSYAGLVEQSGA